MSVTVLAYSDVVVVAAELADEATLDGGFQSNWKQNPSISIIVCAYVLYLSTLTLCKKYLVSV
jgi:hypothetical protein